ncbi:MAG: hypothetical protein LC131_04205 [Anaerolineae bacterium]|nr:hypothetical protein [Rhodocyclaceae bacterium]MCZ2113024.1 hypothetical protein [Anaerolineae bacterium]
MMGINVCRMGRILIVLATLAAIPAQAQAQQEGMSFKNTPEYKRELDAFLNAGGKDIELFNKYYSALADSPKRPRTISELVDRLGNLPGDFTDLVSASTLRAMGLDPNKPVSEQLEVRTANRIQMYMPVKGAEKLTPARMDYYHRFMFTDPIRAIAAGIAPAQERAVVALQNCDRSLLDQAIRELEFVSQSFHRMRGKAEEQKSLINHQIRYYEHELAYLDPDPGAPTDPRLEWRNRLGVNDSQDPPPSIVEYLGLPGNRDTYKTDNREYLKVSRLVNERIDVLNRWLRRIDEVAAYLDRSIPRLQENQQRILQAFKPDACKECR